jgi:hypothetical protein
MKLGTILIYLTELIKIVKVGMRLLGLNYMYRRLVRTA